MFIRSRTLINDLFSDSDKYLNTDIRVCGWIETMRVQCIGININIIDIKTNIGNCSL